MARASALGCTSTSEQARLWLPSNRTLSEEDPVRLPVQPARLVYCYQMCYVQHKSAFALSRPAASSTERQPGATGHQSFARPAPSAQQQHDGHAGFAADLSHLL